MQCKALKTYMETGRVVFVPVGQVVVNPYQPRTVFSQESLEELAESIRRHGVLQPLTVRRVGNDYQLIAGERRLRAAKMSGMEHVPCIVMRMSDEESGMVALVENLQRQDLDFLEEARGISLLMQRWGLSQEQAAAMLGKSQSGVANKLRLLRHSEPVLQALRQAGLTERHARALLKLEDEGQKLAAIGVMAAQGMSVQRAEGYIEALLRGKTEENRVNVGAFLQGVSRSLAKMQKEGIKAVSERRETESEIVVTITIPK